MLQILDKNSELFVRDGYIYFPLLFDPSVEEEITETAKSANGVLVEENIVEVDGKRFIKSISLKSLIDGCEKLDPALFERIRNEVILRYNYGMDPSTIFPDKNLSSIVFQVMPYFVRKHRDFRKEKGCEGDILDVIADRINIPSRFYEDAERLISGEKLMGSIRASDEGIEEPLLEEGIVMVKSVEEWILKSLRVKINREEGERLGQIFSYQERLRNERKKRIAAMLFISEKGAIEIDGFGFMRVAGTHEYIIYKRTGEYALKDFYGRLYLFPDCRVAVSTYSLKPFVMERYKHPFLQWHDSGQEICLRNFVVPREITSESIIKALEEGINAILYGYSGRRRNGYHSLDAEASGFIGMEFEEIDDPLFPRRKTMRRVVFDDYRIPNDHPKIVSGEVKVTNSHTL